jgi:hypothetical protein
MASALGMHYGEARPETSVPARNRWDGPNGGRDNDMRKRGITVRTFDASNGTERPMMTYALAHGPDGRNYVICSEGVGWEVTTDEPLYVQTFSGGYELSLAEVFTASAHGTDVDLADHIRTFGSRLDSNHYMWHARLSGN